MQTILEEQDNLLNSTKYPIKKLDWFDWLGRKKQVNLIIDTKYLTR